jgi:hypothetical protein
MALLVEAAREIVAFVHDQGWSCCIVGGMALQNWGQARTTADVDICLLTGLGEERLFVRLLLANFAARVANASEFAEQNRVLLLAASNRVGIDVALAWTPFEEKMLARAELIEYEPGILLPTATAEDLIVTKAFAARPQDWVDVRGILERQLGQLDWDYIRRELAPLCELKEEPEILDELERMRAAVDAER